MSLSDALADIDLIDHPDGITAGVDQAAATIRDYFDQLLTTEETA